MIVAEDDATCVDEDGRSKDLGRPDMNSVDGAAVDKRSVSDNILGVEHEGDEFFLRKLVKGCVDLL